MSDSNHTYMKKLPVVLIIALAIVYISCRKELQSPSAMKEMKPQLPSTPFDYNAAVINETVKTGGGGWGGGGNSFPSLNNNVATLGRVLFYDNVLSINNAVSCATCHKQALAF